MGVAMAAIRSVSGFMDAYGDVRGLGLISEEYPVGREVFKPP
jgi:hypothetical protein